MAFPSSQDSFNDPTASNKLSNPSHSQLHQDVNGAVEALEAKVGTGASTPSNNTFLIGNGSGTSAWSSLTSSQLASRVSDETGSGSLVFGTSPAITTPSITTSINDANGNEVIKTPATSSAVNEITVTNAATGNKPTISATGDDANISLDIKPKGSSGIVEIVDNNGNEVIKAGVGTSSAVNEVTITNAATGSGPKIAASGDDTNIDVRIVPKGTGNVKRGATGGAIDWWEELGRVTLGNPGDTISVTSLSPRKYLRLMIYVLDTGGTINARARFNNDTGATYADRSSVNGAADATGGSQTSSGLSASASANPKFITADIVNIAAQEKLVIVSCAQVANAGAANAPTRSENLTKWANTADQITSIDIINTGTGDFAAGSEVIVLGHD